MSTNIIGSILRGLKPDIPQKKNGNRFEGKIQGASPGECLRSLQKGGTTGGKRKLKKKPFKDGLAPQALGIPRRPWNPIKRKLHWGKRRQPLGLERPDAISQRNR